MYSNALLIRLLNIVHIKTYITYKILTLIFNFNEVLCNSCNSRMIFFQLQIDSHFLQPMRSECICLSVSHSVHPWVRAKRGIWSKRVFMRTTGLTLRRNWKDRLAGQPIQISYKMTKKKPCTQSGFAKKRTLERKSY